MALQRFPDSQPGQRREKHRHHDQASSAETRLHRPSSSGRRQQAAFPSHPTPAALILRFDGDGANPMHLKAPIEVDFHLGSVVQLPFDGNSNPEEK